MRQLHKRLSVAMLVIVLILGGAFFLLERNSSRLYHEELSQRLNASLAMYIVNEKPLITAGEIDQTALAELAHQAMVINPTAEIYLLNTDGSVLGHVLDPDSVKSDHVNLEPIQELLAGATKLPIKGDDPKNPGLRKVFSVFPVSDSASDSSLAGYLYVVLGGANYEAIAADMAAGYWQRTVAMTIAILAVTAFLAGSLIFFVLTRRLRRLTDDVQKYANTGFSTDHLITDAESSGNEIDGLRRACHTMATTIQRQVESLTENDQLRRELVANVSHDLRTPLAAMQGYIETLLIKDATIDHETRIDYLTTARKHAARLNALIQDLFELAKLDSSRMQPQFEYFPIADLVQDVIQEFELNADSANIRLQVLPPAKPLSVFADISLIQRVVENLVANAVKFTPDGGSISITIRDSHDRVGVTVSDTGSGIEEHDLTRIFDRFYRAEQGEESRATSAGLGLAIAKRILELHGSEITVTSTVSVGTSFEFELPRAQLAA